MGQEKHKRERVIDEVEKALLEKIGKKIKQRILEGKIEPISFETGIARSAIRKIVSGESDLRIVTLYRLVKNLGYRNLAEFFEDIGK
ncbi:MAG: hypothetical protein HYV97_13695 [Bdellovibrio sp.]|nr:hypothetical protein [Bdellovibrio sp.]